MNVRHLLLILLVGLVAPMATTLGQRSVVNEELAPFYHGVASGDPTSNSVILWTRVTPERVDTTIEVSYILALDPELNEVVTSGMVTTDASRDYTVKADVSGLEHETTYYYQFTTGGRTSLIGRTRTTPAQGGEHLKFAVVSCNNFEHGYFNAFERISRRADLDAVIHLGDYIYEYGVGTYGSDLEDRVNDPDHEIVELMDYRTRYSQYRLDQHLRAAHQQHPFFVIWDDHESANDAYADGAENHDPDNEYTDGKLEGDWEERKSAALQAYLEWMPIRETGAGIRRSVSYGDLADLYLLDTRIEGREVQPSSQVQADTSMRTMLGQQQREWWLDGMESSTAQWQIVANQVIFSPLNVGFAAGFADGMIDNTNLDSILATESVFLDIWDGYPQERALILDEVEARGVDNLVILTGDFHSAFAFDVTDEPVIYPNPAAFNLPTPSPTYDPATGEGSLGVEFATPSITSANFDENVGAAVSAQFENTFNGDLPTGNPALPSINYNPHMKFVDLDRHGYFVLDVKPDSVQADYYFVNSVLTVDSMEAFGIGARTLDGENHLNLTINPTPAKDDIPALAPDEITSNTSAVANSQHLVIVGVQPNPLRSRGVIQFSLKKASKVRMQLLDMNGQVVRHMIEDAPYEAGLYRWPFNSEGLPAGHYLITMMTSDGGQATSRFTVVD